jgi:hypothetical protein
MSRQRRKGLDPVAFVDRIELGLSCRAGRSVASGGPEASATGRDRNPDAHDVAAELSLFVVHNYAAHDDARVGVR